MSAVLLFFAIILLLYSIAECRMKKKYNLTVELMEYDNRYYYEMCSDLNLKDCKVQMDLKFFNNHLEKKYATLLAKYTLKFQNRPSIRINGIHDLRKKHFDQIYFSAQSDLPQGFVTLIVTIKMIHKELSNPKINETLITSFHKEGDYDMKLLDGKGKTSLVKILVKVTIRCADNFYGNNCSRYCRDVPNFFKCNVTGHRQCDEDKRGTLCNRYESKHATCNSTQPYNPCDCFASPEKVHKNDEPIYWCGMPFVDCWQQKQQCQQLDETCIFDLQDLQPTCYKEPVSPSPTKETLPIFTLIYIAIGVSAIILIIVITAVCLKKQRKPNPPNRDVKRTRDHLMTDSNL